MVDFLRRFFGEPGRSGFSRVSSAERLKKSFSQIPVVGPDKTREDWMSATAAATVEDINDGRPEQMQKTKPEPEATEPQGEQPPTDPFAANADGQGHDGIWSSKKNAA